MFSDGAYAERLRRFALLEQLREFNPGLLVEPHLLKDLRIKRGQSGVYRDKDSTSHLAPTGVAVSVHHTGRSYEDDLSERFMLYHFPKTFRPGASDREEINSLRNAAKLRIPVFVIIDKGRLRRIELGWIIDLDDESECCLIEFSLTTPPTSFLTEALPALESPFASSPRRRRSLEAVERDPAFKYQVMKRFRGTCALTGIKVHPMLDAAHVVDVRHGGSDVPSNGLLLEKGVHAAFDAQLWCVEPDSLEIVTRPSGPGLAEMGIRFKSLDHLSHLLHPEAIEARWERFAGTGGIRRC